jgi:hypothetical protein
VDELRSQVCRWPRKRVQVLGVFASGLTSVPEVCVGTSMRGRELLTRENPLPVGARAFTYCPTRPHTPLSLKSDHAGLEKSVNPFEVADNDARSLFVEWLP